MVQCILDLANGGYVKTMSVKADPPSPCRSICKLEDNICLGCFRTIHEIKMWRRFTGDEKRKVLKRIANDK